MFEGMFTWSLVGLFAALFSLVFVHDYHLKLYPPASPVLESLVQISQALIALTTMVFLVYYGFKTRWYLPIPLFFIGSFTAGITTGALRSINPYNNSAAATIAIVSVCGMLLWPVAAFLMFRAVR